MNRVFITLGWMMLTSCCAPPSVGPNDRPDVADGGQPVSLCDGSPHLRLGALALPAPSRTPPGQQVMWDNGAHFVYIDGYCRYWALLPGQLWSETRSGLLQPDEAQRLARELHYTNWPTWAGQWIPDNAAADASPFVFYPSLDEKQTIVCHGLCDGPPVPQGLRELATRYRTEIRRLWEHGTAVDGSVRVVAVRARASDYAGVPHFEWPLASLNLGSLAIDEQEAVGMTYGMGLLIEGADAAALRELRRQYVESQVFKNTFHLPVVDRAGSRYKLFLRDSIPLEDSRGLVRPN